MTGRQRHHRTPEPLPTAPATPRGLSLDRTAFEREFPGTSGSAAETTVALIRTAETFLGLMNQALRHHRLSATGREVLAVLDGADTALPAGEIAGRLLVTTASMTTVLDTLERRDLIVRNPDPHDRRRVLIEITPAGRDLIDQVLPEIAALQTAACASLSETRRDELIDLLTTFHERLRTIDLDAALDTVRPRNRTRTT
ncbi:MAG: MarR family transcriptional regulator [Pseudonocardiaceae bacterium]|nr:MAG: MarR family transcriptional regulator [Pseudonocardiaceae bacterium]